MSVDGIEESVCDIWKRKSRCIAVLKKIFFCLFEMLKGGTKCSRGANASPPPKKKKPGGGERERERELTIQLVCIG